METVTAYIGLGSNVGDRIAWLKRAVNDLSANGAVRLLAQSHYYESPALLPENAPSSWDIAFINQVIAIQTSLSADALLVLCQQTEKNLGRTRLGHWGPREIDIDILLYGQLTMHEPHLTIPHSHMAQRDFVLLPLRELAPDSVYPAAGKYEEKTILQLCDELTNVTAKVMDDER